MKKIIYIVISLISLSFITACTSKNDIEGLKIVTTSYVGYDFAKNVIGNKDNINLLLKPGSEAHSYDPTSQDIIALSKADIFIYVGGESDEWVTDTLETIDNKKLVVIKMMDIVENYKEEIVEGMQESHNHEDHNHEDEDEDEHSQGHEHEEYDEHVWTSPKNAMLILEKIAEEIINIDKENMEQYQQNKTAYLNQINEIDSQIKDIVQNAKRNVLIFGARFPFRYFVEAYNLSYYAAFPGCSSETEANAKTITFLINKVKSEKIPVVLKIELSNGNIADTIAEATNTKVMTLHSAHNISKDDFDNNITYVDLMNRNIETLKGALQ